MHARHLYPCCVDARACGVSRDELQQRLRERGRRDTSVHFRAVHLHSYYRERFGFARGMFPHAEAVSDPTLSLPLSPAHARRATSIGSSRPARLSPLMPVTADLRVLFRAPAGPAARLRSPGALPLAGARARRAAAHCDSRRPARARGGARARLRRGRRPGRRAVIARVAPDVADRGRSDRRRRAPLDCLRAPRRLPRGDGARPRSRRLRRRPGGGRQRRALERRSSDRPAGGSEDPQPRAFCAGRASRFSIRRSRRRCAPCASPRAAARPDRARRRAARGARAAPSPAPCGARCRGRRIRIAGGFAVAPAGRSPARDRIPGPARSTGWRASWRRATWPWSAAASRCTKPARAAWPRWRVPVVVPQRPTVRGFVTGGRGARRRDGRGGRRTRGARRRVPAASAGRATRAGGAGPAAGGRPRRGPRGRRHPAAGARRTRGQGLARGHAESLMTSSDLRSRRHALRA